MHIWRLFARACVRACARMCARARVREFCVRVEVFVCVCGCMFLFYFIFFCVLRCFSVYICIGACFALYVSASVTCLLCYMLTYTFTLSQSTHIHHIIPTRIHPRSLSPRAVGVCVCAGDSSCVTGAQHPLCATVNGYRF